MKWNLFGGAFSAVVLALVPVTATNAAVVSFADPYSFSIDETDPYASTLTIHAFDVAVGGGTKTSTKTIYLDEPLPFPPPLTPPSKTFALRTIVDPLGLVSVSEVGPLPIIVPSSGPIVLIDRSGVTSDVVSIPTLTGSWSITGPTEILTRSFSFPRPRSIGVDPPGSFDAANYPTSVDIDPLSASFSYFNRFEVTIDGVDLRVDFAAVYKVYSTGTYDLFLDDIRITGGIVQYPQPSTSSTPRRMQIFERAV